MKKLRKTKKLYRNAFLAAIILSLHRIVLCNRNVDPHNYRNWQKVATDLKDFAEWLVYMCILLEFSFLSSQDPDKISRKYNYLDKRHLVPYAHGFANVIYYTTVF